MPAQLEPITIRTDVITARLIRAVLYELGEHQAAGSPIPVLGSEESTRLGAFLSMLDSQLGGAGRMA